MPGGYGTSIAEILTGKVHIGRPTPPPAQKFVEGTGKPFMTIPPSDFSYFERINALVQQEPTDALDPEIMGAFAAIGIVKGKPFNPDARMKKILTEAAAVGTAAMSRTCIACARIRRFRLYPGPWTNCLWVGGYTFEAPPPMSRRRGSSPSRPPVRRRSIP